jgi:hypothetical protein
MTERRRLPNRRHSEFMDFQSMGMRFTASVSRDPSGKILELFCDNHKAGFPQSARWSATPRSSCPSPCSTTPTSKLRRALCRDSQGRALEPVGSVLDLLAEDDGGAS